MSSKISNFCSGLKTRRTFFSPIFPSMSLLSSSERLTYLSHSVSLVKKQVKGRRKVPMWVHLKNREPFAIAGLWDVWRKPDGKRVESFTIITTEPNELLRPIHNRMPVILRPNDEEQWLDAFSNVFRQGPVTVETLSRRADGRSRRFNNR